MVSAPQLPDLQVRPLQLADLSLLNAVELDELRPLLQQQAFSAAPLKLWRLLRQNSRPQSLVVLAQRRGELEGLLIAEPCNRRGSCWRLEEMVILANAASPLEVANALIRAALERATGAVSWVARCNLHDNHGLAALREQGFQTLQQQQIWLLANLDQLQAAEAMPAPLELQPLCQSNGALLLQLELTATPSHLRQMHDLRSEDLLDDAKPHTLLLVDTRRHQAVAGARLLRRRRPGPTEVELSLHPAWGQLMGPPLALLLREACGSSLPISVRCDIRNTDGMAWLAHQGAEAVSEELVMARSLWRRHELQPAAGLASRTLKRLVGQLQQGQRPVPEAMPWR
jgi:hypothetical protein